MHYGYDFRNRVPAIGRDSDEDPLVVRWRLHFKAAFSYRAASEPRRSLNRAREILDAGEGDSEEDVQRAGPSSNPIQQLQVDYHYRLALVCHWLRVAEQSAPSPSGSEQDTIRAK